MQGPIFRGRKKLTLKLGTNEISIYTYIYTYYLPGVPGGGLGKTGGLKPGPNGEFIGNWLFPAIGIIGVGRTGKRGLIWLYTTPTCWYPAVCPRCSLIFWSIRL